MIPLRAATRSVLDRVEQVTGRSVQFMRDNELEVMATLGMARHGSGYHVLRYRPTDEPLDYLIAHQASFILRLYANPPDQRWDFVPKDSAAALMESLIKSGRPLSQDDAARLPQFAQFVAQWSLLNLRSLPVGMRIDAWIHAELPDLREMQRETLLAQHQEYVAGLSFRVGSLMVPKASLAMVAAHAEFVDRLLGDTRLAVPYKAAGLHDLATEILQCLDAVDPAPTHDTELIDRCAAVCGLGGQYEWKPFQP